MFGKKKTPPAPAPPHRKKWLGSRRALGIHGDTATTSGVTPLQAATAAVAATESATDEPDYSDGPDAPDLDMPEVYDPTLDVGGADAYGLMAPDATPRWNLPGDDTGDAPTEIDAYYDPALPEGTGTLRNYLPDFGMDDRFYSTFGPAAIIGCDIGCAASAALKK